MKRRFTCWQLISFVLLIIALTGCGARDHSDILFIGNSYTEMNDLPDMFKRLARAGGHGVDVEMVAHGGWSLNDHASSPDSIAKIRGHEWDYVVLQEQSEIPSLSDLRLQRMHPAVRQLNNEITAVGAESILFMTWAHRGGLPSEGIPNFTSMQLALEEGYLSIANELDLRVAPVGTAWWNVLRNDSQKNLWADDGSHPTQQGTYLAACVLYAVIFGESPEGIDFDARIGETLATTYQNVAAATVLNYADLWNLPSGQ